MQALTPLQLWSPIVPVVFLHAASATASSSGTQESKVGWLLRLGWSEIEGIDEGAVDTDGRLEVEGVDEGAVDTDGKLEGEFDGKLEGSIDIEGEFDGKLDGAIEGESDGELDGDTDTVVEGEYDGKLDGDTVVEGEYDGKLEGAIDIEGESDGKLVGVPVGANVCLPFQFPFHPSPVHALWLTSSFHPQPFHTQFVGPLLLHGLLPQVHVLLVGRLEGLLVGLPPPPQPQLRSFSEAEDVWKWVAKKAAATTKFIIEMVWYLWLSVELWSNHAESGVAAAKVFGHTAKKVEPASSICWPKLVLHNSAGRNQNSLI